MGCEMRRDLGFMGHCLALTPDTASTPHRRPLLLTPSSRPREGWPSLGRALQARVATTMHCSVASLLPRQQGALGKPRLSR